MKILLLGKNGQLGWELQRALAPLAELVALDRHDPGGDLADTESLFARVTREAPKVIVNAAAYTAVDKAESEPRLAQQINAAAVAALASIAKDLGALLVHYSSDYVFDGSGSEPRDENAPIAPLSVYGAGKAAAEVVIRDVGCQHLILRTSWVYAARGGNFAKTMLRLAAEREQLQVVDDQIGAPTGAELIADVSAQALRQAWEQPALSGLYHLAAGGQTSWHGYARHVIEWARERGQPLKLPADRLLPIPSSAYPTPARRPLNSRLDTRRLQQAFGLQLPDWRAGVNRMLTEILPG